MTTLKDQYTIMGSPYNFGWENRTMIYVTANVISSLSQYRMFDKSFLAHGNKQDYVFSIRFLYFKVIPKSESGLE